MGEMDDSQELSIKTIGMDSTLHKRFSDVLCLLGRLAVAMQEPELAFENGYRKLTWLKLNPDWGN